MPDVQTGRIKWADSVPARDLALSAQHRGPPHGLSPRRTGQLAGGDRIQIQAPRLKSDHSNDDVTPASSGRTGTAMTSGFLQVKPWFSHFRSFVLATRRQVLLLSSHYGSNPQTHTEGKYPARARSPQHAHGQDAHTGSESGACAQPTHHSSPNGEARHALLVDKMTSVSAQRRATLVCSELGNDKDKQKEKVLSEKLGDQSRAGAVLKNQIQTDDPSSIPSSHWPGEGSQPRSLPSPK